MFASRQLQDGNQQLINGDGDVYHISGLVWRAGHGMAMHEATHEPCEIFSLCAAAALYRRDALILIGEFDEEFFAMLRTLI